MKKYVIRDSEGQKTTIYAKNITHALSYVEDSKKLNDSKFYAEEDASEAKRRASKYGLQIKVGKKVSNGPNRGFDEIYYIGPRDKLTKMLKAEGFDDDEIIDMIEDSKTRDIKISAYINLKKGDWFMEEGELYDVYHLIKENYQNVKWKALAEHYEVDTDNHKIVKREDDVINYYDCKWGHVRYKKFNSKQEAFDLLNKMVKQSYDIVTIDSVNESKVKDEASSAITINALIEDEKSATEAYNVAISNLKDKIDAKAMQVLINIRNDERRHIENLYSILNGNITEKNLEDSKMKDSKLYVGISKYDYTKEQAERDARKFGLQLKIVGKSSDPHVEYDAYLIGPRSNILKMLKANGMEDFEEDIEDSIKF